MSDGRRIQSFPFDHPSTYSIWVEGRIDPDWSDRLEGMEVRPSRRKDGTSITLLQGELPDQAALVGLLNALYQMHFVVLKVLRNGDETGAQ
ncbi:MAG: hypothetical protein BroJett021_37190 [Chloroflexota bacterium]|jgi:hypothetical protein|nr:hypothetical protein [Caldilinea sp.]GIK74731.1 MAG: hypothetical protein BroJett021_37190 [Chloroflexota bacterium]